MKRGRYRIEFTGRDGPEDDVPNDEPWEVVDAETGDPVARFAARSQARAWVATAPSDARREEG